MLREFAVEIYIIIFRLFFHLFKLFPIKNKTTFVTSFSENIENIILTMDDYTNIEQQIVVLKKSNIKLNLSEKTNHNTLDYNSIKHFIQSIYHLATSQYVIVDNYYGFLSATYFKDSVICIQIWHAVGAFKQFGLEDHTSQDRTKRATKRFKSVYQRFDHVIVGSDKMMGIFRGAFGLPTNRFITTGIPRTDFFFNKVQKTNAIKKVQEDLPIIKEKKVILYAPTYRDGIFKQEKLPLDVDALYQNFKDEYVVFVRLHPAVLGNFHNEYPDFLYNVSDYFSINYLLLATDVLITDYSSIPFEFSLLHRPMIFFPYDLDDYAKKRGLWENYIDIVPGPIANTTDEIIELLKQNEFPKDRLKIFANEWNKYSNGQSSRHFIDAIYTPHKK